MRDYNNFTFIGRLIEDEFKTFEGSNGRENYARGRFVTDTKDSDGSGMFLTVFVGESVIGNIYQYVTKGKPFIISGRLSQDSFTGKDGVERQGLTVNANSFDFAPLPPRTDGAAPANGGGGARKPTSAKAKGGEKLPF